jgi:hypothetical protein
MYIPTYVYLFIYLFKCIYDTYIYLYIYIFICVYAYICIYIYIYMYILSMCVWNYFFAFMYTCINKYVQDAFVLILKVSVYDSNKSGIYMYIYIYKYQVHLYIYLHLYDICIKMYRVACSLWYGKLVCTIAAKSRLMITTKRMPQIKCSYF